MSFVLPKAAKTSRKLNSLPKELRSIADELIKNKFKEEGPRPQSRDPFRQEYQEEWMGPRVFTTTDEYAATSQRDVYERIDMRTRQRYIVVTLPDESHEGIMMAAKQLDCMNFRGNGRTLFASRELKNYIYNSPDMFTRLMSESNRLMHCIYGMEIKVTPGDHSFIEVRY